MKQWTTISDPTEIRAFLQSRGRMVSGPHRMTKKICHWPYCARCGLVGLKNAATRQALSAACVVEED